MSRFDLFFVLVDECNEVTDYAIARRIVDLHTRQQESVEREYTMVRVVFRVFFVFLRPELIFYIFIRLGLDRKYLALSVDQ